MRTLTRDLGRDYELRVHTDAVAATGICRRHCRGFTWHLDADVTGDQNKIKEKVFDLQHVAGVENMSDIPTKHV